MNNERRYRVLCVGVEDFLSIIKGRVTAKCDGIPDDVKLVGAAYSLYGNCFEVCYEHPSFDPVAINEHCPRDISLMLTRAIPNV